MNLQQDIVLLFTRYPLPGASKTRLIPILGEQGAADLQKKLTEQVVSEADRLTSSQLCSLEIHYSGGDLAMMRDWLGASYIYKQQGEGHIGDKMAKAISSHLGKKRGIILAGSDLPDITSNILSEALQAVTHYDMAIGPACDGGYYLIGVNGNMKANILISLFSDIPWGSANVFAETMAKAHRHHLTSHILPELHDIDRPEDLGYLHHYPNTQ